jgi:hypothetical protein
MAKPFFDRLNTYYQRVAAVLRGEAQVASVFPNATDIGMARERVYAEFLRQHAPSKCNVFLGGFLSGNNGDESTQMDVLITTDTNLRFNFHNSDGQGKSFSSVDGALGVASIKSTLDKHSLEDSLAGLATIPATADLTGRVAFTFSINNYDNWPYKIIYASDGISPEAMLNHLETFYAKNSLIPLGRRPNCIHVAGKYVIFRATEGMNSVWDAGQQATESMRIGQFRVFLLDPDLQALIRVLEELQARAVASTHILFSYQQLINRVVGIPERASEPCQQPLAPDPTVFMVTTDSARVGS